jgi:hypothetical protein
MVFSWVVAARNEWEMTGVIEQVIGEVDLHTGGGAVVIAVGGKAVRVGLPCPRQASYRGRGEPRTSPPRGGAQAGGSWITLSINKASSKLRNRRFANESPQA